MPTTSNLSDNTNDLHTSIVTALEHGFLTVTVGQDTSDGSPPFTKQKFPLIADMSKVAARVAAFDGAPTPEVGVPYSLTTTDAMRKIIEAIVKETVSYIVVNAELAAKERYDKLESDYNNLLLAIQTASSGIASTPQVPVTNATLSAILNAILLAGGTGLRSAKTEILINKNEVILKSDGSPASVDIK